MSRTIDDLIADVMAGSSTGFAPLVQALRAEACSIDRLVALLGHGNPLVRRAALSACGARKASALIEPVKALAADAIVEVRIDVAEAIGAAKWPLDEVLSSLLADDDARVRAAAAKAATGRAALVDLLASTLDDDDDWIVRQAVAESLEHGEATKALPALVQALAEDDDRDVSRMCARTAERILERAGGWPEAAPAPTAEGLEAVIARVDALGARRTPRLLAWAKERLAAGLDPDRLRKFGTDLTTEAEAGHLSHAYNVDVACEAVIETVTGSGPRAVVLLGPPGSGKTAVVNEVVHRLRAHPSGAWRVLRVNPSEILAGTVYLGEWQTKVKELIETVKAPRRVLLYVPNLSELSQAGKASKTDLNVATMLAPHVESGAVAILGESTAEAFRTGLGEVASLRRLFVPVELAEADAAETRAILRAVRDESGAAIADADLDRLAELAGMYLAGTAEPGRAVGLLRRVVESRESEAAPIKARDVLRTLATSTGVPVDLLDDDVPLDLGRVRQFFEARVMGQPEAVSAVVDLVALVKAGLNDPNKPYGALLFVGPTGVGKTEMARSLAELLFGDPSRLLRFDMSEYATHDAFERLIGARGQPGLLTSQVRERPFSVVLLDEIEKAHLNAFDLLLQVLDAGRLTDDRGVTADFRRTIVILTSNLGSAVPTEAGLGFGPAGGVPPPPDRDQVVREVLRFFRPEFVNRLDQVVSFRPLSLETAEQIARREVARVLERGGLTRRRLAVDVDPAVLTLLLRHGYSPSFGARPLKRTVERFVLLPLAHALARGAATPGSLVRLTAHGDRVHVDIHAAEASDPTATKSPVDADAQRDPPRETAGPGADASDAAKAQAVLKRADEDLRRAEPFAQRKTELLARSRAAGFWSDRAAARRILDEVHRLERVVEAASRAAREARFAADGVAKKPAGARRRGDERRIDAASRLVATASALLGAAERSDLGDAYVRVARVRSDGEALDGVAKIAQMIDGRARRLGLEVETVDDRRGGQPVEDTIALLVAGAGGYALLASEAGFHQFLRRAGREGRKAIGAGREWVRVEIVRAPRGEPEAIRAAVKVRSRALKPAHSATGRRIRKPTVEVTLLHEPSRVSVTGVGADGREKAVEVLLPWLLARVEAAADPQSNPPPTGVVRRYHVGPDAKVVDRRTGATCGHVDRVLAGELELLAI